MPAPKGRAWKMERASVNKPGVKRPVSNKYSDSDSSKKPGSGERQKFWVGGHERNGKPVKGHYRDNPNYKGKK